MSCNTTGIYLGVCSVLCALSAATVLAIVQLLLCNCSCAACTTSACLSQHDIDRCINQHSRMYSTTILIHITTIERRKSTYYFVL